MKFNLTELNPGTRFFFNDADPSEGSVTLRICNGAALDLIRAETAKTRVEYKNGQRYEVMKVNDEKRAEMIWDYCIVSWDNITDNEGNPLECTIANKALLMKGSVFFANFYSKSIDKLNALIIEKQEASEKN